MPDFPLEKQGKADDQPTPKPKNLNVLKGFDLERMNGRPSSSSGRPVGNFDVIRGGTGRSTRSFYTSPFVQESVF